MEIEGTIILDLGIQSGTSKAGNLWMKGEWVLETGGTYPKKVKFHIFGEERLRNLLPQMKPGLTFEAVKDQQASLVGTPVALSFDLESREFNGRWYTDVAVYAVRTPGAVNTQGPAGPQTFGNPTPYPPQQPYGGAPVGYPPAPEANTGFAPQPAAPAPDQGFGDGGSSDDLPF